VNDESTKVSKELEENLKLCSDIELLYFITKCIEELTKRAKS